MDELVLIQKKLLEKKLQYVHACIIECRLIILANRRVCRNVDAELSAQAERAYNARSYDMIIDAHERIKDYYL